MVVNRVENVLVRKSYVADIFSISIVFEVGWKDSRLVLHGITFQIKCMLTSSRRPVLEEPPPRPPPVAPMPQPPPRPGPGYQGRVPIPIQMPNAPPPPVPGPVPTPTTAAPTTRLRPNPRVIINTPITLPPGYALPPGWAVIPAHNVQLVPPSTQLASPMSPQPIPTPQMVSPDSLPNVVGTPGDVTFGPQFGNHTDHVHPPSGPSGPPPPSDGTNIPIINAENSSSASTSTNMCT